MRTLAICGIPFAPDGSGYYRFWLPYKQLIDRSFHRFIIPPPGQFPTLEQIMQLDVLAMQRPAGIEGVRMMEQLAGRVKVVYETDDDMLQVNPSGLPHLDDERMRETIRRCLRLADLVTVSSEPLASQVRRYNDNVRVLPNFIDEGLLNIVRPRRPRLTLGWAGGPSHLVDMVTVAEPLTRVLERNPQVDMHFMGFDYSPLVGRDCRLSGWKQNVWDYYNLIDFDIAVIPIADKPFNRSKTPIKALEMAALGIPVVASNLPPYSEFVADGKTGYLVSSATEWERRLDELIHDEAARAELGANAKEQARDWTIQDGWKLWNSAYEAICE